MTITLRSVFKAIGFSFLFYSLPVTAQQLNSTYTVEVKNTRITPVANASEWFGNRMNGEAETVQVLLQFNGPLTDAQRQALHVSGIRLLDYISVNCYSAIVTRQSGQINVAATGLRSVITMQASWKIDDRISKQFNLQSSKSSTLLVSVIPGVTFTQLEQYLKASGAIVTSKKYEPGGAYIVSVPNNRITSIALLPVVKYVGIPGDIQPLNYDARGASGAHYLGSISATSGYSLDGSGVTLGIGDNASGIFHVDDRDRVINFHPDGPSMHGVHTTTTMAGKGIMEPWTKGMAPSAKILANIYDAVWLQSPALFKDYDMTATNNSYANVAGDCSYAGTYDQYAEMLDKQQIENPFTQHIFASGNDGPMQCGAYPQGYHTVNGGYQPAKNILTVGAMAKDNIIWPKSSRGPVNDGRLKPEVMAYGFSIYSGDIFDGYGHSNGTSMSCPVVTGGFGLMQQRFKQLHSGQNAPAALLKALAMNGATDVGNPGPDYLHGYGLFNLYRTIQMMDNNRYIIDSVNQGLTKTHIISVPANTSQLKVMIYWHDVPASLTAAKALVNDVDLEVIEPNNINHKPLILDPSAANVTNNAVEGVDNRNNSEQVVVNSPATGNYTVTIKGTSLPTTGRQSYVLVYDFVPVGVKIKQPVTDVPVRGNDSIRVYWDASNDPNSFTLEYSTNNGANWTVLNANVAPDQRQYVWYTPNQSTTQAKFRVKRNNTSQQDETGSFVVNPQPVVTLSSNQCPGYISIDWTSVPGVSGYEIMKKIGDDMRPIDTVLPSTNNYVLSGLAFDSMYYVGIRPMVNGVSGWRSISVKRTPNDGNCAGNISDGDLLAEAIVSPNSGRLQTSTVLTSNETLTIKLHNLDDANANSYRVSYSLNGGAWQSQTLTSPIPPNSTATVSFTGLNLAAAGVYKIVAAVQNQAIIDNVRSNDTIIKFVRQLNNGQIDLNNTFIDDFETASQFTVMKDSMGVTANEHWDYVNSIDSGRLRNFVNSDVTIDGQRSISLDLFTNRPDNQNHFTGTFNLQGYNTASTEARLDFDFKLHGRPKFLAGNEVWVRGNDTQPWLNIYTFDTLALVAGQKLNTGSLPVSTILANGSQNFSSSFQVRIGQHDTSVIAMNEYGNGMTIDNFRLYSVKNDMQLLSIVSPEKFKCNTDSAEVSVRVFNSDNLPQDTIEIAYRFDGGPVIRDTLFSIAAKDTVLFTFDKHIDISTIGQHTLDVWLRAQGDSYLPNDSVMNYQLRNQPDIRMFPYLESFENGDGNWFADGVNSSWEYGTPNGTKQKKAASGTKVWATSLNGNYNANERSFLYSPCFDLWTLTNPVLSFSFSTDIENCGSSICDQAYVEYSTDGLNWSKLGAHGEGFNWYGDLEVWTDTNARWRVASIPLPAGMTSVKLRFVFRSDNGSARDGIAIDDIHIFDLKNSIYDGSTTDVENNVNSAGYVSFVKDNKVLAQLRANNIGLTKTDMYAHSYVFNPVVRQYHIGRNYVINSAANDSTTVRLFITDDEVVKMVNDHTCDTCSKAEDAYRLGILKYDDASKDRENGSLSDNISNGYTFIPYTNIQWIPYDKGYYAQIKVNSLSEFWFTTRIPDRHVNGPTVFPNPVFDDKINIVWTAAPGTEMKVAMWDVIGRKVYQSSFTSSDYETRSTIELPNMEPGVYVLRYYIGSQVSTVKILVQ